jgi:O-antigen/teichoic acid export membrane protein
MAWVVFGQILAFAGSFVGVKVLINVMGPQTYGQLALGLTVAGVLNLFIYGPIANVIARYFIIYREKNQLDAFFGVLKAAHKIMAAIVLISCLCAGVLIYCLIGYEWAMIVVISSLFGLTSGIAYCL